MTRCSLFHSNTDWGSKVGPEVQADVGQFQVSLLDSKGPLHQASKRLIQKTVVTPTMHPSLSQHSGYSSVQSLSRVRLFSTLWTAACQASLSITNSRSLLKFMSIELVKSSNHLILCHPLLLLPSIFPSLGSFPMSQFFASGGQNIGLSASASVLPVNIQDWFPLGWIGSISLQSKGLSRVFSNTIVQKHQFFGAHLSL